MGGFNECTSLIAARHSNLRLCIKLK